MPTKDASKFIGKDDENALYYTIYDNGAKSNAVGFQVMDNIVEGVSVADANTGVLYATVKLNRKWFQEQLMNGMTQQ